MLLGILTRKNERGEAEVPRVPILIALVSLIAIAAGLLIALVGSGADLDERTTPLVLTVLGFIGTITTSLVTLLYSQKTNQAVQGGALVEQTKQGTHEALREANIVTRDGPTVTAQLAALDANTAALARILGRLVDDTPQDQGPRQEGRDSEA